MNGPSPLSRRRVRFAEPLPGLLRLACLIPAAFLSAGFLWAEDPLDPADTDHDGLPDEWEIRYFGDLRQDAQGDFDGDGHTNLEEYQNGTDPSIADP